MPFDTSDWLKFAGYVCACVVTAVSSSEEKNTRRIEADCSTDLFIENGF